MKSEFTRIHMVPCVQIVNFNSCSMILNKEIEEHIVLELKWVREEILCPVTMLFGKKNKDIAAAALVAAAPSATRVAAASHGTTAAACGGSRRMPQPPPVLTDVWYTQSHDKMHGSQEICGCGAAALKQTPHCFWIWRNALETVIFAQLELLYNILIYFDRHDN